MKQTTNGDFHTLRLILGDQLNARHSWFRQRNKGVLYVIAELRQETDYVTHHQQKLCAFFAAMAEFAEALQSAGHQVLHLNLDDTVRDKDLPALVGRLCKHYGVKNFGYQRPDEHRLLSQLEQLTIRGVAIEQADTEHFLLPFEEIEEQFQPGQDRTMERFYRSMRKRFSILMDGDKPEGGKWNYDRENRKTLSYSDIEALPEPLTFANDVSAVRQRLARQQVAHFGQCQDALVWPVNRKQAQQLLSFFCRHCLSNFGRFQDAMTAQGPHRWALYHSRLSFALNTKMLHPRDVIDAAVRRYRDNDDVDLAQVEGFVRQILGWREFVRGIYWANMPAYYKRNKLRAQRKLPAYFWHGRTHMACMSESLGQSLTCAYAHHIQRLMITGNFALLTGINPKAVDAWYLGVYVDAIEWVELPNTRGMSQYADGGLLATKPYAAGGNYINKMSDYCRNCHYQVKQKTGKQACPFNSLYWHFMARHRDKLENNPRVGMIYRNWDRQSAEQRKAVLDRAQWCLDNIESL